MSPKQFVPIFVAISLGLILTMAVLWEFAVPKAYADFIEYTGGKILKTSPNFCIFEPITEQIKWEKRGLLNETTDAIKDWESKLSNYTNNDGWKMNVIYYKNATHFGIEDPHEFPLCDVFIVFPSNTTDFGSAVGTTGYDYSQSKHKFAFISIKTYDDFRVNITNNGSDIKVKVILEKAYFPAKTIGIVVKHELGHALGLGHFYCHPICSGNKSIMRTNIGSPFSPHPNMQIEDIDLEGVVSIYGKDGWAGKTPVHDKRFTVPQR